MAQKKIGDLTLRADFDATCQLPVDDAVQTWRATGAQIKTYILSTGAIITAMIAAAAVTRAKLATGAIAAAAVVSKTANYTLDPATDDVVLCSSSGGAFAVTLPDCATNSGKRFTIKKTDSSSNAVTITRAGSDTMDGATTLAMTVQYESITLVSGGGTAWSIIS